MFSFSIENATITSIFAVIFCLDYLSKTYVRKKVLSQQIQIHTKHQMNSFTWEKNHVFFRFVQYLKPDGYKTWYN